MNPAEHYRIAEALAEKAASDTYPDPRVLTLAQVHATLALAPERES